MISSAKLPEHVERRISRLEHANERHEAHARENAGALSAVSHGFESVGARLDAVDERLDALDVAHRAEASVAALFRARTTLALERLEKAAGTERTGSLSEEAIAEMLRVEAAAKRESVRARAERRGLAYGFLGDLRRAIVPVLLVLGLLAAARIRACSPVLETLQIGD